MQDVIRLSVWNKVIMLELQCKNPSSQRRMTIWEVSGVKTIHSGLQRSGEQWSGQILHVLHKWERACAAYTNRTVQVGTLDPCSEGVWGALLCCEGAFCWALLPVEGKVTAEYLLITFILWSTGHEGSRLNKLSLKCTSLMNRLSDYSAVWMINKEFTWRYKTVFSSLKILHKVELLVFKSLLSASLKERKPTPAGSH